MTLSSDISVGLHAASAADTGAPYMALALGPAVAARVVVHPESQPRFGGYLGASYRYMTYNRAEYYGRPWANEADVVLGASWTFGTTVQHGPEAELGYFTSFVSQPDAYLGPRSRTFHGLVMSLGYSATLASPLSVVWGVGTVVGHKDARGPLSFGHLGFRLRFWP
jgi:hypothetical protein